MAPPSPLITLFLEKLQSSIYALGDNRYKEPPLPWVALFPIKFDLVMFKFLTLLVTYIAPPLLRAVTFSKLLLNIKILSPPVIYNAPPSFVAEPL